MRGFALIEKIFDEQVLCIGSGNWVSFSKGKFIARNKESFEKVCEYELWKGIKKSRIVQRLMRLVPRTAIELENDIFLISCKGVMYRYDTKKNNLKIEMRYRVGMSSPLYISKNDSSTPDVCFGDYLNSNEKFSISIHCRKNDYWEKVYSFPDNRIKHIHNIIWDSKQKKWIVLTGDSDGESGFWICDEYFNNMNLLIGGKQKYRACFARIVEDGIVYASDTPDNANYIRKIIFHENHVKEIDLFEINGTCINGNVIDSDCYFISCVEPKVYKNKLKYYFSYNLPNGIKDKRVHIYKLNEQMVLKEIFNIEKDILPGVLFGFGNAKVVGKISKGMLVSFSCVKKYDGKTILLKSEE